MLSVLHTVFFQHSKLQKRNCLQDGKREYIYSTILYLLKKFTCKRPPAQFKPVLFKGELQFVCMGFFLKQKTTFLKNYGPTILNTDLNAVCEEVLFLNTEQEYWRFAFFYSGWRCPYGTYTQWEPGAEHRDRLHGVRLRVWRLLRDGPCPEARLYRGRVPGWSDGRGTCFL